MNNRPKLVPFSLLLALPLAMVCSSANAVPLNVVNPGFEDISGENPSNQFTFGPLNGWDLYDPENITGGGAGNTFFIGTLTPFVPDPIGNPGVYENFPDGAPEGQRLAIAFNFQGSDGLGEYGLVATLADTLAANTVYNLQVLVGNIASAGSFDLQGLPGYRVDLLAGGVVIAQDNNSLFGSIDDGEFVNTSISLTTGLAHPQLGQTLGIRLVNLNQVDPDFPASDLEVNFDDIRLDATATIPGNFDQDHDVDGRDFLIWQRGFSDLFNANDYADWEANFPAPPQFAASTQVPEPTTLGLLFSMAWIMVSFRVSREDSR
ncbi:MAG: PEP-CTERM sorting domain-containing protein [Planctomycetes bacterium]|nr:PEP-CTERM sorting domain-containing protein [Planctomycetota bacterium]